MSAKLSAAQQDLLDAMRKGVRVHYISGVDAYYFRTDTMRRCSATVYVLKARGLVESEKKAYGHNVKLVGAGQSGPEDEPAGMASPGAGK